MTIELDEAFDSHQREDWLALAEKGLPDGQTLASLASTTLDGRSIDALYSDRPTTTPLRVDESLLTKKSYSTDDPIWDNRVAVWMCTPRLTNEACLEALEGGATSIELHLGDHTGWSATDLPEALKGVYLDAAAISIRTPCAQAEAANALMDLWDSMGIAPSDAKGAFNMDPIGDHVRGLTDKSFSLVASLQNLKTFAAHTSTRFPNIQTVLIDGCSHHNAGATATQELLAVMATGCLYLEALKDTSLDPALISQTVQLQMSADANTLMGVVKLRSLKMLWQHLLVQLELPASSPQLVVETSKRHLSVLDPWVNHLRNSAAVSAAAFVNAETVIVHPHNVINGKCLDDEELGRRVARNLPIVLSEESRLTDVQDPFAGSYAIEHLCQDLCNAVWSALAEYKTAGAWFDTVTNGQWQDALFQSHISRSAQLGSSENIKVGINRYRTDNVTKEYRAPLPGTATDKPSTLLTVRDAETFEEPLS